MVTAFCYDPYFLEHDLPGHPESRARLERTVLAVEREGLFARMVAVRPRPVEESVLARVHHPGYIDLLRRAAAHGMDFLDADTYVGPRSYDVARLAAGGCVEVVRAVLEGQAMNGIALVRPPGHHARPARGMGFCLLNNIAIAARAALDGYRIDRVLIVDWDVHHGNGTQEAFYSSPQVLFFSTHQYPHYPGTGHWRETGEGAGQGFTVNVPLPSGIGDDGFRRIYAELLEPMAERYRPELILVSAGYDAHWNDPLAGLQLSLSGYWEMSRHVVALADAFCAGRLIVCLEGGYALDVLARGVADTCRALLHEADPGPDPLGPSPWAGRSAEDVIRNVKAAHGL